MLKILSKLFLLLLTTLTVSQTITAQVTIECRQPTSTVADEGLCGATNLEVLPPFILSGTAPYTVTSNMPFFYPVGTTTITWTVTDNTGAFASCQSTVIIEDDQMPEIGPCETEISLTGPNSCMGLAVIEPPISDNCGILSVTGFGDFIYPVGSTEHTITVVDVNGNVKEHVITVNVHDDYAPVFSFCPEETIDLPSSTFPANLTPQAGDNCNVASITNDIPASGLPAGTSEVTFVATDDYGNEATCVVTVTVPGGITLRPQGTIASSLNSDQSGQTVSWNALAATTSCTACADKNLAAMTYVGDYWGHQYFLANETSMTRAQAQEMANTYDAHLAVINTAEENAYLVDALGADVRSAWIGLGAETVSGQTSLSWENGDAVEFSAENFEAANLTENVGVILTQDGSWEVATLDEEKYFLIERPCADFQQVAPLVIGNDISSPELLRSGDVWPQGNYEVTYAVTDICGNSTEMTFDVNVVPGLAEYCTSAGEDNGVWIEKVVFHDLINESGDDTGYADFTEVNTEMNIGDGVILLQLAAGGNESAQKLYWSVYFDANADGDFFDANELLYQVASIEDVTANIELPIATTEAGRLRVVVSKHNFAEACGDISVGEIEDYNLTLTIPQDVTFKPANDATISGISIMPNPATSYATISLGDHTGENVSVKVYDALGRIRSVNTTDATLNLNLNTLSTGLYFVAIELNDGTTVTKRLIVK